MAFALPSTRPPEFKLALGCFRDLQISPGQRCHLQGCSLSDCTLHWVHTSAGPPVSTLGLSMCCFHCAKAEIHRFYTLSPVHLGLHSPLILQVSMPVTSSWTGSIRDTRGQQAKALCSVYRWMPLPAPSQSLRNMPKGLDLARHRPPAGGRVLPSVLLSEPRICELPNIVLTASSFSPIWSKGPRVLQRGCS